MGEASGVAVQLPTPLAVALEQPAGARWVRVALQVNPFEYSGANAPRNSYADEAAYNEAIVAKCKELKIEMVAITDHWRVDSAAGLIGACERAGIVALPGFEANSESGGAHMLVIFPAGTPATDINAAIGACGDNVSPGCAPGTPGKSFSDICTAMTKRGALVIAPHVNTPSGILSAMSGQALSLQWRCEDFQAAGVSPGQALSQQQRDVLENRTAEFERAHPVAVLHADDVCHADRLPADGATSWIKMSTPSLEGLRVAVRTPDTRIRTQDPESTPHARIRAIAWEGGFLDGLRLQLNESLTAIIGGRGTGKSTIIESLRYVLDIPAIAEKARADHTDFVRKVLRDSTTVSVLVESLTPTRQDFIIERTVPNLPIVKDVAGTVLAQRPLDLLGRVEIFSQHELAELAEDKTYVAQLLERFAGVDPDRDERDAVKRALTINRKAILEVAAELEELRDRLADLPRVREQVARFAEAGIDARLEEQQHLQHEERLLDTAGERIASVSPAAEGLRQGGLLDAGFVSVAALEQLPRKDLLEEVAPILQRLRAGIDAALQQLEAAVQDASTGLDGLRERWRAATDSLRQQYDEVVRNLQDAGLDAAGYLAVTARVERLSAEVPRREELERHLETLKTERRQLLARNQALDAAAYRRLSEACRTANEHLKGDVVVRPMRGRDRQRLERIVRDHVAGQRTQIVAAIQREDFAPAAFAVASRAGAETLGDEFGIRGAQATSLASAGEQLFMLLEEETIPLAAEAQLNVATAGIRYKNLDDLSKGQKATALLLLLLTSGASPLIIDQPEDNLDNRFIYDGVVPRLRDLKGGRQVIVSTHNANVPILGDAELVVAMESEGNRGRTCDGGVGSIDDETVRKLAGTLLEGGKDAFAARQYLYGY